MYYELIKRNTEYRFYYQQLERCIGLGESRQGEGPARGRGLPEVGGCQGEGPARGRGLPEVGGCQGEGAARGRGLPGGGVCKKRRQDC